MISEKTIRPIIQEELGKANNVHPQFASQHEAYAVLKEELEEAHDEMKRCFELLDKMWEEVKNNESTLNTLKSIKNRAVYLIQESIQVGAMAQKGIDAQTLDLNFKSIQDVLKAGDN